MSTSAFDHYKVAWAKQKKNIAQVEAEEAAESLEVLQEEQARLQEAVNDVEALLASKKEEEAAASLEIKEAEAKAAETTKESLGVEFDPKTGLPAGEKIACTTEQRVFMEMISAARTAMDKDGDVVKARLLEAKAAKYAEEGEVPVEPRLLGLDSDAFQASQVEFCERECLPNEEELARTFAYARDHPEKTDPSMDMFQAMCLGLYVSGLTPQRYDCPRDVNTTILWRIFQQREELAKSYREETANSDDDQEEQEGDNEVEFYMSDEAWDAVEAAIRNQIPIDREKNASETALPREGSATIARYNPRAHFTFQSDAAVASVPPLDNALASCKLRTRPSDWLKKNKRTPRPFEYHTGGSLRAFDVDGDFIAMCGDLWYDELCGSKACIAFGDVHYPTNLEAAETMSDLTDKITGDDKPWAEAVSSMSQNGYFTSCLVDAERSSVWASSSNSGRILGFSTIPSVSRSERRIGLLKFNDTEVKAQKKFLNGSFDIIRCNEFIVGSAGTNRLSIWSISKAMDEFPGMAHPKEKDADGDNERNDDSSSNEDRKPAAKRPKLEAYKGLAPKTATVEEGKFATGDIQWVTGSQLLVAPSPYGKSCAVRLYDIASESIIGLFCGGQSSITSIGKQLCVGSNLVFTSESSGTAYAWDTRTYRPAVMLHTHSADQVLGVPGDSGIFAFTYGSSKCESISCWDLRMPVCHAYTMATGNSTVASLHWHARTASLFAATNTEHHITHGRFSGHMYGEPLSDDEEDLVSHGDYWPHGAKHQRNYFGPDDWHGGSPVVLQYMFDNGIPTGSL